MFRGRSRDFQEVSGSTPEISKRLRECRHFRGVSVISGAFKIALGLRGVLWVLQGFQGVSRAIQGLSMTSQVASWDSGAFTGFKWRIKGVPECLNLYQRRFMKHQGCFRGLRGAQLGFNKFLVRSRDLKRVPVALQEVSRDFRGFHSCRRFYGF